MPLTCLLPAVVPNPPIPCSLPLPLSLSLPLYSFYICKGQNSIYIYIFCLLGGLRTVNKIFQLGCLLHVAQRTCLAWVCVCVCVRVSLWSACSCTAERKESRHAEGERERERVYNRVEHRKLFILFLCFNLYLIQFLCSLFFRLPRFNMHFNQNVYVMYVKSRYQNVAILKKYIEIGAHTTKYK